MARECGCGIVRLGCEHAQGRALSGVHERCMPVLARRERRGARSGRLATRHQELSAERSAVAVGCMSAAGFDDSQCERNPLCTRGYKHGGWGGHCCIGKKNAKPARGRGSSVGRGGGARGARGAGMAQPDWPAPDATAANDSTQPADSAPPRCATTWRHARTSGRHTPLLFTGLGIGTRGAWLV
jgi:hypothetical protein